MKKLLFIFLSISLILSSCQKKHISISKVNDNFYNVEFHNGVNFNIGKKWKPLIQIGNIQQENNDWRFAIKMLNVSKDEFFAANFYSTFFVH